MATAANQNEPPAEATVPLSPEDEEILIKHFSKDSKYHDVALVIEGREIWVCRSTLSHFSPVFEAMFSDEFKEKTKNKIPLPGKKFAEVFEFVRCLFACPKMKQIDEENVKIILQFADEYNVEDLKGRAEIFFETFLRRAPVSLEYDSLIKLLKIAAKNKCWEIVRKYVQELGAEEEKDLDKWYRDPDMPISLLALILDFKVKWISGIRWHGANSDLMEMLKEEINSN